MLPSAQKRSLLVDDEIIDLITPALVLVAPVGMDEEVQAIWFAAACSALDVYSGREIAAGVKVAMRTADHPSKVVPAIVKAIAALESYQRDTGARPAMRQPALPPPAPSTEPLRLTQDEVDAQNDRFRAVGVSTRWQLNANGEVEDAPAEIEEAA